jgi:hypothetical protein
MPRPLRPAVLAILLASLALGAGATRSAAQAASAPLHLGAGPWVAVTGNAAVSVTVDTSRIVPTGGRRQVWMGFDLAQAWPPIEDLEAPYRHFEARYDVDCVRHRTRGLAMRFVDVNGTAYDRASPDSTWTTFREHPLTENAFLPLCRRLAQLSRR